MPVPVNGFTPRSTSPSAQVYARPPSAQFSKRPATPPASPAKSAGRLDTSLTSLSPAKGGSALEKAKAVYRTAAKAFLHREHDGTWAALNRGEELVRSALGLKRDEGYGKWWLEYRSEGAAEEDNEAELLEVLRKLQILRITFVATLSATPPSARPSTFSDPQLSSWLSLPPETLIYALWAALSSYRSESSPPPTKKPAPLPEADPSLTALHPSLATATALAALKISAPQAARKVCEAWLGAAIGDDELGEKLLALSNESIHDQGQNGVNGVIEDKAANGVVATTTVLGAYARLVEVYAVHVLGGLDEWADAAEFIRGQSKESGGFLTDDSIEGMLHTLHATHAHRARTASRAKELEVQKKRQAQREREEAERARIARAESEIANTPARTREEKGKGREREKEKERPGLKSGRSSEERTERKKKEEMTTSAAVAAPLRGFAALRSALSNQLVPPAASSSAVATSASGREAPWWPLIRAYLPPFLARDPFRLVSAVLCLLALSSLVRRRVRFGGGGGTGGMSAAERARMRLRAGTGVVRGGAGGGGVGAALAMAYSKVVETVKMGTQVTYL